MSFSSPRTVMAIGYLLAGAMTLVGWHTPVVGLGIGLAVILTLINIISLVVLGCFAWQISSFVGPEDPEFRPCDALRVPTSTRWSFLALRVPTSTRAVLLHALGSVLAAALLVVSFLVFVQTGGLAP